MGARTARRRATQGSLLQLAFRWPRQADAHESAFRLSAGRSGHGIQINPSRVVCESDELHTVDYWPNRKDLKTAGGKAFTDVGALVVCRRPLGTKLDVTTIVLCGYSSVATVDMADQLIRELCPMAPGDLEPAGRPFLAIRRTGFATKAGDTGRAPRKTNSKWLRLQLR